MASFIKKIFIQKVDDNCHRQFIRFGKGTFPGRAALNLMKGEKIKLRGGFEFANDFVEIVSEIGDCKFSGIILSREEIAGLEGRRKTAVWEYSVENIDSEKVREIKGKAYTMMLDAEGQGISLKMKKKLPKPGKSTEAKVDDKFCMLEADLKYWNQIRDAFMLPECKKAKISHIYIIDEIVMPKNEKDFAKIREMAKRKGKLIRKQEIDGREETSELEFEA